MMNDVMERLRAVERLASIPVEIPELDVDTLPSYTWQSARALVPSTGHRLYADRPGSIVYCRAERSAGDGTSTATLDVLKNGSSIFTANAKPSVDAGEFLGPERAPDTTTFVKGDYFEIEIEATGGGTGPLRVTIRFQEAE